MPFRTRDYLLFMLTVAFLLLGITSTAKMDISKAGQEASVLLFNENEEEVVYQAVTPEPVPETRTSRLAALRDKIANLVPKVIEEEEVEAIEEEEAVAEQEVAEVVPGAVILCGNYTEINPAWSASNLQFEIVEGARIVYRNVQPEAKVDELGQVIASTTEREVVLQLPLRTFPSAQKTCLSTDVVGVALDGSLIRNNEQNLYRVFGQETLVGYALDGFPIYGVNQELKTDECGGFETTDGYKYFLSSDREGILGCFGGTPTAL